MLPEMSRKRRQSRAATNHWIWNSIALALDNHDLLMQILLRLPAKSLIRFKSVCKKWLSLISSDHLCHQHTLRHPKLQQSLIIHMRSSQLFYLKQTINGDGGKKVMIPYSLQSFGEHKILQACHGLLLLECENRYYIYNPTTRRSRKISLTNRDDFPYVVAITLAFDPSKSPYYKVVCIRSTEESNPPSYAFYDHLIEVYDSESHTWKLGLERSTCDEIYNDGLHWNNLIFWSTPVGDHFCFDIAKNEGAIVCFSKHPYNLYDSTSNFLVESNGHLYHFVVLTSGGNASVEGVVSELVADDSHFGWNCKYLGAIHEHPEMDISGVCLMVTSLGDGSTCSVITYEGNRRRIMAYNYLDKDDSELLVDLTGQPVSESDHVIRAFQFGEILALV